MSRMKYASIIQTKFTEAFEKRKKRWYSKIENGNSPNSENVTIGKDGEIIIKYKFKENAKLNKLAPLKEKSLSEEAKNSKTPPVIVKFIDCTVPKEKPQQTIFDDRSDEGETQVTKYDEEIKDKLGRLYKYLGEVGGQQADNMPGGLYNHPRPEEVELAYMSTDASNPTDVVIGASYNDGLKVKVTYRGKKQQLRDLEVVKAK